MGSQLSTRCNQCIRPGGDASEIGLAEVGYTPGEKAPQGTHANDDELYISFHEFVADTDASSNAKSTGEGVPEGIPATAGVKRTVEKAPEDAADGAKPSVTDAGSAAPFVSTDVYTPGDEVFVVGLQAQPQHNGESGLIVGRQGDRFKVTLASGVGLAVRPKNLSRGRSPRARA
jgi:hypothetical protein